MKFDNYFVLFYFMIIICGCSDITFTTKGYKKAVLSGIKQIPEASQIDEIFNKKNVDHSISYSGSLKVGNTFRSKAYFGGRYTLSMEVPVRMGRSFDQVLEVLGEPKFYLNEVKEINVSSSGQVGAIYNTSLKTPYPFDVATWKKIYEAKGDFSVVDIQLKYDQPVKHFREYKKAWRGDMIKVKR